MQENTLHRTMSRLCQKTAGGVLNLGMAKTGCRTYLAVAGGFEVPKVMGRCIPDLVIPGTGKSTADLR